MTAAPVQCSLRGGRDYNEDYLACHERRGVQLFICCDGLGGHGSGDVAARAFAQGLLAEFEAWLDDQGAWHAERSQDAVTRWFARAQQHLIDTVKREKADDNAKTTVALAASSNRALLCANCGDSRIYRIGVDGSLWRSRDHSLVQLLVDDGEVAEEAMGTHADQGKLFRSIAVDSPPQPAVKLQEPLQNGELLLLCSDGFWEHISAQEILALRGSELQSALPALATRAVDRAGGSSDNVSVLACYGPPPTPPWWQRLRKRGRCLPTCA